MAFKLNQITTSTKMSDAIYTNGERKQLTIFSL